MHPQKTLLTNLKNTGADVFCFAIGVFRNGYAWAGGAIVGGVSWSLTLVGIEIPKTGYVVIGIVGLVFVASFRMWRAERNAKNALELKLVRRVDYSLIRKAIGEAQKLLAEHTEDQGGDRYNHWDFNKAQQMESKWREKMKEWTASTIAILAGSGTGWVSQFERATQPGTTYTWGYTGDENATKFRGLFHSVGNTIRARLKVLRDILEEYDVPEKLPRAASTE